MLGFLTGVFGTGLMLSLVAMMSDVAANTGAQSNQRYEGLVSGIWLAVEKVGFAAGALIVGLTLSAFGFVESTSGTAAPQSERALIGIAFAYLGVGSFLYVITLVLVLWVGRSRASERD